MADPRVLYLGRQLLDHQIVTHDGTPVGKVDDLELDAEPSGGPLVTALLTGQTYLGQRIGGRLGGWVTRIAQRLRGTSDDGPRRFDVSNVENVGHTVVLGTPAGETPTAALERWTREHFVQRLPGA